MNIDQHDTAPSTIAVFARGTTYLWLAVSAVNFVVWLAVSAISGNLDTPWFLYAFAAGGVVVGALHLAARARPHAPGPVRAMRTAPVAPPAGSPAATHAGPVTAGAAASDW